MGAAERALRCPDAEPRDITSLQNWLDTNGSISREGEAYLQHSRDLCAVAPVTDSALVYIEDWVERRLSRMPGLPDVSYAERLACSYTHLIGRKQKSQDISATPSVVIYSGTLIKRMATGLMIALVTILLLLPIVICNLIMSGPVRLFVVMVSTVVYLLVLAALTRAKTTELVVAATT